ncbi:MAG: hypothetical protein J6A75_03425 [Lachnospiraceae bacterium]|nr:hypothetical protein [Lachnospiraceae bacterium]
MKNTKLNKRKNVFVMFALMLMFALTMTTVVSAGITPAYANEGGEGAETPDTAVDAVTGALTGGTDNSAGNSGGGSDYSLDTLEKNAEDAISDVQDFLVKISFALFPVALIVGLLALFFTHDERKISLTVKICGTILVVTALIIFINGGHALNLVKEFTENAFK